MFSIHKIVCTKVAIKLRKKSQFFHVKRTKPSFACIRFAKEMNTPNDYLPILIQIGVAVGFVALTLGISHLLGPNRKTAKREDNFECGIENQGNARFPVSVKYFLSAILFVLFDVEVIFFYPYAVNFKEMGWEGFGAVVAFVGFFLLGFIYVWKRGALEWEK